MTEDRALVLVGTYSQAVPHVPDAHGRGIEVLDVDFGSARATTRLVYGEVVNPSYIHLDEQRRLLYATSERWEGVEGRVSALSFDDGMSRVERRTELPSGGRAPCYVSTFGGRVLLLSNYDDGSLASFTLGGDGHLVAAASVVRLAGNGPDRLRQDGAHAHCIIGHPSSGRAYAADLGSDRLHRMSVDLSTGSLTLEGETAASPGAGPRHLAITPAGDRLLCIHELSSQVGVFEIAGTGELRPGVHVSTRPPGKRGPNAGGDLIVTGSGSHAYASNRGDDSIVALLIDQTTGELIPQGWRPSGGRTPRSLTLSPDDRHLIVANQDSDLLQVFDISAATGRLAEAFSISVATPACVRCVRWSPW